MTFRWFGSDNDTVTLEQIRQIPGVSGVVVALHNAKAGEVWEVDDIRKMYDEVKSHALNMECIESVNVHEDIKLGLPTRDKYIENYIKTIKNLSLFGVKVICYNFMPIFDWTRTDLAMNLDDGSTCLCYDSKYIEGKNPQQMFEEIDKNSNNLEMPGWEKYRIPTIKALFEKYEGVTEQMLWDNLKYFLESIMPTCEQCDIKMAIHPDDPPWNIFGLPRIIKDKDSITKLLTMVDNKYNGLALCTGSLGANKNNDIIDIIKSCKDRIYFAHLRNVLVSNDGFYETSHLSSDGSLDMYEIIKTLQYTGFDGYVRPDHGRMLWGEKARPGYGLFDRALGVAYINGLWEAVEKSRKDNQCLITKI